MDKIDTWIENRFGTKPTFSRLLLDNFIEFLEKELGYKSPEEIKKQSDERAKKVFRQTVKALERRYKDYVRKADDQSLPTCTYGEVEAYDNTSKVRGQSIQALAQAKMLKEHWVKVKEKSNGEG